MSILRGKTPHVFEGRRRRQRFFQKIFVLISVQNIYDHHSYCKVSRPKQTRERTLPLVTKHADSSTNVRTLLSILCGQCW